MLTGFHIGNFKAFGKVQYMPIKKLNLIFGPNSGGKSSLLHGLMYGHLLIKSAKNNRNSYENKCNIDIYKFRIGNNVVDLGGFKNYIFKHDLSSEIIMGFDLSSSDFYHLWDYSNRDEISPLTPHCWDPEENEFKNHYEQDNIHIDIKILSSKVNEYRLKIGNELIVKSKFDDDSLKKTGEIRFNVVLNNILENIFKINKVNAKSTSKTNKPNPSFDPFGLLKEFRTYDKDEKQKNTLITKSISGSIEKLEPYLTLLKSGLPGSFGPLSNKEIINEICSYYCLSVNDIRPFWIDLSGNVFLQLITNRVYNALSDITSTIQYCPATRTHITRDVNSFNNKYASLITTLTRNKYELLKKINTSKLMADTPYELSIPSYSLNIDDSDPRREPIVFNDDISNALNELGKHPESSEAVNSFKKLVKSYNEISEENVRDIITSEEYGKMPGVNDTVDMIKIWDKNKKIFLDFPDLGVGIGHIMPVLLTSYGYNNSIIIVEEPELHLHPSLQSETGDLFIESAMELNNTVFVETHSEYLILRILRRIRETANGTLPKGAIAIKPEDVSVVYVQPGKDGAELIELPVDNKGNFTKQWPNGFFADRDKDLFYE